MGRPERQPTRRGRTRNSTPNQHRRPRLLHGAPGRPDRSILRLPAVSRPSGSDRWLIAVSRRLSDPDGSFAGAAVALIDQSYFVRAYRSIDLGPRGVVAMADYPGHIFARQPPIDPASRRGHSLARRRSPADRRCRQLRNGEPDRPNAPYRRIQVGRDASGGRSRQLPSRRPAGLLVSASLHVRPRGAARHFRHPARDRPPDVADRQSRLQEPHPRGDAGEHGPRAVHVRRPAAADRLQRALRQDVRAQARRDAPGNVAALHPRGAGRRGKLAGGGPGIHRHPHRRGHPQRAVFRGERVARRTRGRGDPPADRGRRLGRHPPGHHRQPARRGEGRVHGASRPADRPRQPHQLHGEARGGGRAPAPAPRDLHRVHARSRPLQERQRFARPSRRRRAPQGDRQPPDDGAARDRSRGAARRRRIRDHPGRRARPARRRGRTRQAPHRADLRALRSRRQRGDHRHQHRHRDGDASRTSIPTR